MEGLKESLETNKRILLIFSSVDYNDETFKIMEELSGKSVVYVTTNKTYDSLKEGFEKKKIDLSKVVFIDSISKTIKKTPTQSENVFYCSSPGALTELSLVISKFIKHDFEYLIFDSLTNLLVYQKENAVSKLINSLTNKLDSGKTKAIFYAVGEKEDESISKFSAGMDEVIEIK